MVNAIAVAYDEDGEEITMPASIMIRPQFMTPNALVNLSRCKVITVEDGKRSEHSSSMLRVSGLNGKMKLDELLPLMKPKFMTPDEPENPEAPKDPEEEDKKTK